MKKKTKEQLLEQYKKANKQYKLNILKREGYKTEEAYLKYLTGKSKSRTKTAKVKPKVHFIAILDNSSSMAGSKYHAAREGLLSELSTLPTDTIDYEISIITFCEVDRVNLLCWRFTPNVEAFKKMLPSYPTEMTPLNDAIGTALNAVEKENKDKNVVLSIFTDGGENSSRIYSLNEVQRLIKEAKSKGYTVTFVGTNDDVEEMIKTYGVSKSNTLSHDNTADSIKQVFNARSMANVSYSTSLANNEDVSEGYFTKDLK